MTDDRQLIQDLNIAHPRTLAQVAYRQMKALERIADMLEKFEPAIIKLPNHDIPPMKPTISDPEVVSAFNAGEQHRRRRPLPTDRGGPPDAA